MYVARLQREVRLGVSSRVWLRCSGSVGRDGRTMGRLGGTVPSARLVAGLRLTLARQQTEA